MGDVAPQLPKGAGPSAVGDDFGDVYGLLLAITSDGYSPAELKRYATDLKKGAEPGPGGGARGALGRPGSADLP